MVILLSNINNIFTVYAHTFINKFNFYRPVLKKEDPKPLLNPEVDLASSVLETLREVTDQEYQEALVRDAAKGVLKLMEPEFPESQPRNVVNIIVTPKDRINDDTISEASEIQGSSCVPPPLSRYNDFDNLRLHSPRKLLKQIFSPSIFKSNGISDRNRNDMDDSASHIQELVSKPLKNNIFENLKTRLNSLNLKPLSNIDNRDFLTSPKNYQKYNLKNNIKDRMQLRNKPLVQPRTQNIFTETRQELTKNNAGTMNIQPIDVDKNQGSTVLLDKNLRPVKANILRNTDCSDTVPDSKETFKYNNKADLDVVPSPSKVVEVKSPDILENFHDVEQQREADKCIDEVLDSDTDASNINPSISETVPENNSFLKSIEVATEVNSEDAKVIQEKCNDSETNHSIEEENVDDLESESSSTKNIRTDLKNDAHEEGISSTEDETQVKIGDSKNSKELPTGEKQKMTYSRTHTLPNIKADILKTLEKFKQANEKIQEKLRSNVQDALQLVVTNKPQNSLSDTTTETYSQSEIRASSTEQLKDDNNFTSITSENNNNAQDLEKKSESQLEQSNLKDSTEASLKSDCEMDLNEKSAEVSKTYVNDDMITSPTSLGEVNYPKPSEDEMKRMSTEDLQKMSDSLLERSAFKDDEKVPVATESDEYEKILKDKSAEVDKVFDDTITLPTSLGKINYPTKPFGDQRNQMNTEGLQNMSDSLLERSTLTDDDKASLVTKSDQNNKNLKEKFAEVDKVLDDMITSPTSFDEKKYLKTFKDRNSYIDNKDNIIIRNKPNIDDENVCAYNMPRNTESSNIKNADNEMNSQPSNSIFNSVSQTDLNPTYLGSLRDFAVEPEVNINPIEGIKGFFNSLRPLGRNTFTIGDDDSNFFTNQGLFGFSNDENMASSKGFTRGDTSRLNSDTNLNSFKAKVASPKSLDVGSLVPSLGNSDDNDADVLGFASQSIQKTTNFKNVLENNLKNGFNPLFKTVQSPKMLQDTFNSLAPRLSDSFKSHKDNAIKTFRETLDVVGGEPFSIDKNNLLGRPLISSDDLFGAVLKTHDDFHDKLQAFHSDLNRRFGSINPRISSLGDTQLLGTPSKFKNTKNRADLFHKNTATMPAKLKPVSKNMLFTKNIPTLESIKNKLIDAGSGSSKIDMLKPNNKPKLGFMQRPDSGLKKGSFSINPPRSYGSTKIPTKNNIKLKPLKENKVTISFATTTTRPDSLKFRSSGGSKLPKLTKSLKDNKLKASKLESKDPRASASEISTSRAQLTDTLKKSKMVPKISSIEESLDSNQNNDNRHLTSIPEANNRKDLLLSKIKNAFASRSANDDDTRRKSNVLSSTKNENILDATQSASTNIDTSISATSLVGDTVKDNNRSFQCKMVCIKDFLDSTDAYKT